MLWIWIAVRALEDHIACSGEYIKECERKAEKALCQYAESFTTIWALADAVALFGETH